MLYFGNQKITHMGGKKIYRVIMITDSVPAGTRKLVTANGETLLSSIGERILTRDQAELL